MSAISDKMVQNGEVVNFDLIRLSKSKQAVDCAPNTIRSYAGQGLRLFRCGKAVWFSKSELESFIKGRAA